MHRNNRDCVRVLGVDSMGAVAFSIACATFHGCPVDESTPVLTGNGKDARINSNLFRFTIAIHIATWAIYACSRAHISTPFRTFLSIKLHNFKYPVFDFARQMQYLQASVRPMNPNRSHFSTFCLSFMRLLAAHFCTVLNWIITRNRVLDLLYGNSNLTISAESKQNYCTLAAHYWENIERHIHTKLTAWLSKIYACIEKANKKKIIYKRARCMDVTRLIAKTFQFCFVVLCLFQYFARLMN